MSSKAPDILGTYCYTTAVDYLEQALVYNRRIGNAQIPAQEIRDVARQVSREIALRLFRLQRDEKNHQPGFREKWFKDIDFVAAALESWRLPSEDDYAHLGVVAEGDYRLENLDALLRSGPFT